MRASGASKNATRVYIPTISDARRCLTESIDGLIAAAAITLNDFATAIRLQFERSRGAGATGFTRPQMG